MKINGAELETADLDLASAAVASGGRLAGLRVVPDHHDTIFLLNDTGADFELRYLAGEIVVDARRLCSARRDLLGLVKNSRRRG